MTAKAAALYHAAAAMAPGSGTVARMSEEMYVERPACINYVVRSPEHTQRNALKYGGAFRATKICQCSAHYENMQITILTITTRKSLVV